MDVEVLAVQPKTVRAPRAEERRHEAARVRADAAERGAGQRDEARRRLLGVTLPTAAQGAACNPKIAREQLAAVRLRREQRLLDAPDPLVGSDHVVVPDAQRQLARERRHLRARVVPSFPRAE